ncbi:hypothetical protein GCM10027610_051540 [Dactylosporangium cerinum]
MEDQVPDLPLTDLTRIETPADFARALTGARVAAGLSIRDAAKLLSRQGPAPVSTSTLGGWFSGSHLPTLKLVNAGMFTDLLRICGETDEERIDLWLDTLRRVRSTPGRRPSSMQSPFRGLAPYEPEHAEFFFGRSALTAELVQLVHNGGSGPVMVIGPSGSGKSSLLRAGLIPALCGTDAVSERCALLTPGTDPMSRLVDAGIIVVDQFEEVFTACEDTDARQRFIDALGVAAADGRTVVIGMRADFYAQALQYPSLRTALQHRQLAVGPMTEDELRQAITGPARRAGLELEPGLVETLLHDLRQRSLSSADTAHEAGVLPLLSHALLATWDQATGRTLTTAHYRSSGGIHGAVAKTAEDAFGALTTDEQRDAARRLFLRLVRTDDGAVHTRRWIGRADWVGDGTDPARRVVLDRFVDARLLTAGTDLVGIAHEALLAAWPRLTDWLDADAAWRRFHRTLASTAEHWQETGRDPDGVFRGATLDTAQEWLTAGTRRRDLDDVERDFIDASLARREADQLRGRRQVRRRQQTIALVAALATLALSVGFYAHQAEAASRHERQVANRIAAEALSRLVAGKADRLRGKDVSLAMQLSLVAYRIAPTAEARSSLLNATALPAAARLPSPAGQVTLAALSGDGRRIVAVADQNTVQTWSANPDGSFAGQPAPIPAGAGTASAVAAAVDGATFVVGAVDGSVLVHSDTRAPRALTGGTERVASLAISPDGRTLASGDAAGILRLWNLADTARTTPMTTITVSDQTVSALAFGPTGGVLAVGGFDATIRLLDVADPRRVTLPPTLPGPTSKVFAVAISPDGHWLAAGTGAQHNAYVWDITDPARPVSGGPP